MENYFGLIELLVFYGIAIGIAFWQWSKMRREVRESRERKAREAAELAEKTEDPPQSGA